MPEGDCEELKMSVGGGECRVVFSDDLFNPDNPCLAETLRAATGCEKPSMMLVADSNAINRLPGIGTKIGRYITAHGISLAGNATLVAGGEKIKCDEMQTVRKLMNQALECKVGKNDAMLVIGGGTLFDIAGYAAAQVRGGINTVRIPTTTSAAVDAAFSSVAAIDSQNVKNAFEIPCRASAVLVDFSCLFTVLDGVWRGGLGEIVRHASVLDAPLMRKIARNADALKNKEKSVAVETVKSCIASRAKKGTSSFALWSAHRLEAISGYKLPHGYAVPIGICIDCAYACEKKMLSEEDQETICRALADCGALDGLQHSNHLLSKTDSILYGLDSWNLSFPGAGIAVPAGIGKMAFEKNPDREAIKKVIKEFLEVSTSS